MSDSISGFTAHYVSYVLRHFPQIADLQPRATPSCDFLAPSRESAQMAHKRRDSQTCSPIPPVMSFHVRCSSSPHMVIPIRGVCAQSASAVPALSHTISHLVCRMRAHRWRHVARTTTPDFTFLSCKSPHMIIPIRSVCPSAGATRAPQTRLDEREQLDRRAAL